MLKLPALLLTPLLFGQSVPITDAGTFSPSFADMGSIEEGESITFDAGGEDFTFGEGDRPEDVVTLGSLLSLGVGELTLDDIIERTGIDDALLTLGDFPLLAESTIQDVAESVNNDEGFLETVLVGDRTVEQAIDSGDGEEALGDLLDAETLLSDIAGVQDAVIEDLTNYQNAAVSAIPGLPLLPFASYPAQLANSSLAAISLFAKADLILDAAEMGIDNTVTGSTEEATGFATPCPQNSSCGHVELKDYLSVGLAGKRFVNGAQHRVRGGSGVLGELFGSTEPTGRLPFGPGSPFKIVLTDTDESTDQASFSAYFRLSGFLAGDTGYNIGPFPLYSTGIDGAVWLGVNPNDLGRIPVGFDPSAPQSVASSAPNGSAGLFSPVGAGPSGEGEEGQCASQNSGNIKYEFPAQGTITSLFGPRVPPCAVCSSFHGGLDVASDSGTPIIAGEGGTVIFSGVAGGLGNAVFIEIECTGHVLGYGHNRANNVRVGEQVRRGQQIAEMGTTGASTGVHSHFIVEVGGIAVDPLRYL